MDYSISMSNCNMVIDFQNNPNIIITVIVLESRV